MFHKSKKSKDGLAHKCKDCAKQYRLDNVEHIKELNKRYRETHKEQINEWRRQNYQKTKDRKHKRYIELSQMMNKLKTPCIKCGEGRPHVIDFHHVDPSQKMFNIGKAKTYSKEVLQSEIDKCVCLCRNCHTEFHYFYGNNPENPVTALEEYLSGERIVELLTKKEGD